MPRLTKVRNINMTDVFGCPDCELKFNNKTAVNLHMKFVHKNTNKGIAHFGCFICKKKFKTREQHQNHIKIHIPPLKKSVLKDFCFKKKKE